MWFRIFINSSRLLIFVMKQDKTFLIISLILLVIFSHINNIFVSFLLALIFSSGGYYAWIAFKLNSKEYQDLNLFPVRLAEKADYKKRRAILIPLFLVMSTIFTLQVGNFPLLAPRILVQDFVREKVILAGQVFLVSTVNLSLTPSLVNVNNFDGVSCASLPYNGVIHGAEPTSYNSFIKTAYDGNNLEVCNQAASWYIEKIPVSVRVTESYPLITPEKVDAFKVDGETPSLNVRIQYKNTEDIPLYIQNLSLTQGGFYNTNYYDGCSDPNCLRGGLYGIMLIFVNSTSNTPVCANVSSSRVYLAQLTMSTGYLFENVLIPYNISIPEKSSRSFNLTIVRSICNNR